MVSERTSVELDEWSGSCRFELSGCDPRFVVTRAEQRVEPVEDGRSTSV